MIYVLANLDHSSFLFKFSQIVRERGWGRYRESTMQCRNVHTGQGQGPIPCTGVKRATLAPHPHLRGH